MERILEKTIKLDAPIWTLDKAQHVMRGIELAAQRTGYYAAMYGSVLTHGEGRDLDIVMVPWRHSCSYESALTGILSLYGGHIVDSYIGAMDTRSYVIMLRDKYLLDIQFREVERVY